MKRNIYAVFAVAGLILAGCSSTSVSGSSFSLSDDDPGFMENYSIFKPVPVAESGIRAWRYMNPRFANHEYKAAIVSSAKIYDPKFACQIPYATIDGGEKFIMEQTRQALINNKFALASRSGEAVLDLDMSVTGAFMDAKSGKLQNIVPVSTAITYAASESIAVARDKKAVLFVGGKAIDTQSGLLVVGSFVAVPANNFVNKTDTAADFESALAPWLKLSLENFIINK